VISLAQVRKLELRVGKVVDALRVQSAENASLRQRVNELEARLDELGSEISSRRADEEEIEAGLQGVFDILDRVDASNGASGEAQSGNDANPNADETESESFSENHENNLGSQADADNPSPAINESSTKTMPEEETHHPEDSESEAANSGDADDDRFQSEFDIF